MILDEVTIPQKDFEMLQPIILVTRYLGLLPVTDIKHGGQVKLKKSLVYMAYSCVLTIFLSGFTIFGVAQDLQRDERHSLRMEDKKSRVVTCCDILMIIVIALFGTVTLPQKLRQLWKLLACLNQVDLVMPPIRTSTFRRSSIVFIAAVFVVAVLITVLDIIVLSMKPGKIVHDTALYVNNYGAFYVLYLVVVMQEVFFWHLIFFIKTRIVLLNKYLGCICKDNLYKRFSVLEQSTKFNPILLKGFKESHLKKRSTHEPSLVEKITSLIRCQEKIFDAVQSINACSAYGLNLIMLSCLVHLTVTPYFLLLEVKKEDPNMFYICVQAFWVLIHVARVLIIVEPCQQCLSEQQKTLILLCDLLNSNFDENLKDVLIMFATHLNFCKIRFTSCGFFKINRSLITSLAAAVSTYLVVLFQFETSQ